MDLISDRVSVQRTAESTSVVVSSRLPRWQEGLLVMWSLAWIAIGAYVVYSLLNTPAGDLRSFLFAFMAFWLWFALRIGRVTLWRLKGFELMRVKSGTLTIKDSIFGYGRANDYFVENIQRFGPIAVDETSWKWQLNDSFWVMGGERLGFEYNGKKVVFGKGIDAKEAQGVARVIDRAFKDHRKSQRS